MRIMKTTFTFTVLHDDGIGFDTINEALAEAEEGMAIGLETGCTTVRVPDDQVEAELLALNNDGTFFNDADSGLLS